MLCCDFSLSLSFLSFSAEIELLHEQRKHLCDAFRADELAYVAAREQSREEEKERRVQKREQSKMDREKMR